MKNLKFLYFLTFLFVLPALAKAGNLPSIVFNPDSTYFSGIVQISIPQASEDIFQIKLLCDNETLDVFFKFPAIFSLDTTAYPEGIHLLTERAVIKGVGVREKDCCLCFNNQNKRPADSLSLLYQAIEEQNYQSAIEYLEKAKEEERYLFLKDSLSFQIRLLEDLCKENFPVYQYRNDKKILEKLSFSERFPSPILQIFSLRLLSKVSIRESDFSLADNCYSRLSSLYPEKITSEIILEHLKIAKFLGNDYKEKELYSQLKSVLQKSPREDSPEYLYYFALSEKGIGNREEAENLFRKLLETDFSSQAKFQLAVIEEERGNYQKAISSLLPLSTESRKDRLEDYSRYHLAVCYYNLGKHKEAQKYFERVAYTYTRIEEAPLSLYYDGLCLLKLKEYKKAGERFALLVKEFPLHPFSKEAEYLVAESIYQNAKKERWGANPTATLNYILKYLDEVIDKYPGTELSDKSYYLRAEAIRKLTDTYNEMKNYEAARRTYALLVGYEELGLKPPEKKKKEEGEKPKKAKEQNPIIKNYFKLAEDLWLEKQYQPAIHLYKQILLESPETPYASWAQYQIGCCYAGLEKYEKAVEELLKVEQNYPKSEFVDDALERAGTYQAGFLDDHKGAIALYQRIIEKYPESNNAPLAQYLIALTYLGLDDLRQAKLNFRRVIEVYPGSDLAKRAVEKIREITKREKEARRKNKK